MTANEFKECAIDVLKYCLAETKETTLDDRLSGIELELSNAYCEGLEDAIDKISKIYPVET